MNIPDSVKQTLADVLGLERPAVFVRFVLEVSGVFCLLLGLALHLVDLPEAAGDRRALEADLAVVGAVDVADQHVDRGVVALLGQSQHVLKRPRAGEQR